MRHLLLIGSLMIGTMVHGQSRLGLFGGGQLDAIHYRIPEEDPRYNDPRESKSMSIGSGGGGGWHLGGSFVSGRTKAAFKGSIVYSELHVNSSYLIRDENIGLAFYNYSATDGTIKEKFQMIDAPLLLSISVGKVLRFEAGLSPWTLVAVRKCDRSTVSSSSWIYTLGSSTSQNESETCSSSTKPYSRYGFSGVLGLTGMIKDRISISGSCLTSFIPVYNGQDPYKGHLTAFRLSVGYFINLRRVKIGA